MLNSLSWTFILIPQLGDVGFRENGYQKYCLRWHTMLAIGEESCC